MIKIAVVSRQGLPVARPMVAQFGAAGGTLGRADTNTLVLEDTERTVSRVHAQVLCRNGQFFIVDRGSNPMQSNGRPLGAGNEAPLADGDRLIIGNFELAVQRLDSGAPAAPPSATPTMSTTSITPMAPPSPSGLGADDDPFADLLAGLGGPAASPATPAPASTHVAAAAASAVPFPAPASASALDADWFADPLGTAAPAAAQGIADPFADLLGGPSPAASPDDFAGIGLPPSTPGSAGIDGLFGGMGGLGDFGADPLALSPLADPLRQPNTAGSADPLAAFGSPPPATAASRSDHLPMGQFGYVPPVAVAAAAPLAAPASSPAPAPVPVPRASPPAAPPTGSDALLAAFLRGLGGTHQPPEALTPELMERVGAMLRSATEGTLQLLLTRQEFKREVRAEVTMIASQANNPLKFSPTVEVALAHLLGPGVRGFMPAEAAMRDAYDDLRAHQFGVMVGLRAALAHVIARFEPSELEKKIAARSALDSLFAANRKAKLWDQFVALYAGIATEAEDDFHSLFGKAFLQAYEEQMARLKSGASGP
ncbi:MAG: type VI secretion system-associated FHA domain protein TagH [Pseudomonadota bacterium]